MAYIIKKDKSFKSFPYAMCATDCKVQKVNRPSSQNFTKAKKYFSEKHKEYGYKTEISVLSIGPCIFSTPHKPASTQDISIFWDNIKRHQIAISKSSRDDIEKENEELLDEHAGKWAISTDECYQGLAREVRATTPSKKEHRLPKDDQSKSQLKDCLWQNYCGKLFRQENAAVGCFRRGTHFIRDNVWYCWKRLSLFD